MNDILKQLLEALKSTSAGTKAIAALVAVGMVAVFSVAGVLVNRPHLELTFSGLDDHEVATVNKALSEAGIRFEVSQPPGPYVVFVDQSERSKAYMSVYGSGALDKPLKGILSDAGISSVFNSAEERSQSVRKREWEEMEKMLEELDFVVSARVRTSTSSGGSQLTGSESGQSASVTLRVVGNAQLDRAQAATVANLVSSGLGIDKRSLTISDQAGRSVYDGNDQNENGFAVKNLLQHQTDYDTRLSSQANRILEDILGPSKARVTISSEWDFAQTTTSRETSEKGTVVQESKTNSEKPVSLGRANNVAGLSSNVLTPGDESKDAQPEMAEPLVEKTTEERKDYEPSRSKEERVRLAPELKRLSVALFLDQSIEASQKESLETAIKASVGYSDGRDAFSSVVLPFVLPPEVEAPASVVTEEPAKPNPMLELALRRGVEIVSALVFLILLAKSLKGSKRGTAEAAEAAREAEIEPVDAELLARVQIDELLRSDPSKVGEILSRWAREETVTSA